MHRRGFYRSQVREAYAARFASELAGALYDLGIKHKELAQALGVTHHTVDSWTRVADPKLPGQHNLVALCVLLEARKEGVGQKVARAAGMDMSATVRFPAYSDGEEGAHPALLSPGEKGHVASLDDAPASSPAVGNIAPTLSEFIGRTAEVEEVRRLLREVRLLTLTGTGGVGKTRLALQVASGYKAADFPDGVWLVELDALSDPELIPGSIARATGITQTQRLGEEPMQTLAAQLRERRLLLVLDNCEHLVQACAEIAETLLQQCSYLCILATSREPLDCAGETARLVPALSVPEMPPTSDAPTEIEIVGSGASTDPGIGKSDSAYQASASFSPLAVEGSEAAQLFVARARERQADFRITVRNAPYLAQICRRLDGIPLALELAATRVQGMTLEEIATRLDASLHLLTQGRRTGLPRHRALQASLDWSHDLLAHPEQMLFRRLAVFAGGWTLNAAEAVCSGDGLSTYGVLGNLMQLVSKSLVVAEQRADGTRYRFHETVRQYALEKLDGRPAINGGKTEKEDLQRRHAHYFSLLVEGSAPRFSFERRPDWNKMVVRELDNIRAALAWALPEKSVDRSGPQRPPPDLERVELGLRLAGTLFVFWSSRGETEEGLEWIERALHYSDPARRTATRARVLLAAGILVDQLGHFVRADDASSPLAKARGWLEESEAIWRELRDTRSLADTLMALGSLNFYEGDLEVSRALLEESLALAREVGNAFALFFALFKWGDFELERGNLELAQQRLRESLDVANTLGDRGLGTLPLCSLGRIEWLRGDYEAGRALIEEALAIRTEIGDEWPIAGAQAGLAEIMRSSLDYTKAALLAEKSLAVYRKFGDSSNAAWMLYTQGNIAKGLGDYERAIRLWCESLTLSKSLGKALDIVLCLAALSGAYYSTGKLEQAATLFGFVDRVLDARPLPWPPDDREDYVRARSYTRAAMGDETFAVAWEAGSTLTQDEAVTYIMA